MVVINPNLIAMGAYAASQRARAAAESARLELQRQQRELESAQKAREQAERARRESERRAEAEAAAKEARRAADKETVFQVSQAMDALAACNLSADDFPAFRKLAENIKGRSIQSTSFDSFEDKAFFARLVKTMDALEREFKVLLLQREGEIAIQRVENVRQAVALIAQDPPSIDSLAALKAQSATLAGLGADLPEAAGADSLRQEIDALRQNIQAECDKAENARKEGILKHGRDGIEQLCAEGPSAAVFLALIWHAADLPRRGSLAPGTNRAAGVAPAFEALKDRDVLRVLVQEAEARGRKTLADMPPEAVARLWKLKALRRMGGLLAKLDQCGRDALGESARAQSAKAELQAIPGPGRRTSNFEMVLAIPDVVYPLGVAALFWIAALLFAALAVVELLSPVARTGNGPAVCWVLAAAIAVTALVIGFFSPFQKVKTRISRNKARAEELSLAIKAAESKLEELRRQSASCIAEIRALDALDPAVRERVERFEFPSDEASAFQCSAAAECEEHRRTLGIDIAFLPVLDKA